MTNKEAETGFLSVDSPDPLFIAQARMSDGANERSEGDISRAEDVGSVPFYKVAIGAIRRTVSRAPDAVLNPLERAADGLRQADRTDLTADMLDTVLHSSR